jgi:uncharacterized protein YdhG (YjbR/CyaY superfamily)
VRSDAPTAREYLAELPVERRERVAAVRAAILAGLPEGYEEGIELGMLSYHVPLRRYPDTYNGAPLAYAGLASQKRHISLYLIGLYSDEGNRAWFEAAAAERGLKLDTGKSCVRFRRADELPLDLVSEAVARFGVDEYIAVHEAGRAVAGR